MRRQITFALVLAAALTPAQAVASTSAKGKKRPAVRVLQCKSGDASESRLATFLSRIRATSGTDRMAMRFTLLERFGDERRRRVDFPELRTWHFSKPGIKDFRYKQTVTGLHGGGEYRVRVDYRWYDSDGNLLRKARRMSGACRQPGQLPNLIPGPPAIRSGPEGTAVYTVPVSNRGKAPASEVAVELYVDGAATNVGQIDTIAAGERREVRFTGPVCQRNVRVVVDPADTVKERRESDNALTFACPPFPG